MWYCFFQSGRRRSHEKNRDDVRYTVYGVSVAAGSGVGVRFFLNFFFLGETFFLRGFRRKMERSLMLDTAVIFRYIYTVPVA